MLNNDLDNINKKHNIVKTSEPQKKRGSIWKFFSKSNTLKSIYYFFQSRIKNEQLKDIISIDTESSNPKCRTSYLSKQTKVYNQLLKFLSNKEIVYIFPWIGLGGADKVSVEYTKALTSKNSCAITSVKPGERIKSINIPHLNLLSDLNEWDTLSEEAKLDIFVQAIINSPIKLVHIVNSDFGLKTIKYYHSLYKEYNIKTIVTLFCPDYDWGNHEYHGYPIMYPELFENADLILSDNNYWYDFFKKLNKNRAFVYKKLASPTEPTEISYQEKAKNTKKILWASRICNQKLFNVLEEIINQLPKYTFVIYGSAKDEISNQEILERLIKKGNVVFRGEYQHISEIDLNEFDLYLFTSFFEGIPTIILDMAMGGIPIVSADVGGISEVLGKDYPLLVKNQLHVDDYITKIEEFYNNKDSIISEMLKIRNLLLQKYNEKIFQKEYNILVKDLLDDCR